LAVNVLTGLVVPDSHRSAATMLMFPYVRNDFGQLRLLEAPNSAANRAHARLSPTDDENPSVSV
jgi:hypothetical protein